MGRASSADQVLARVETQGRSLSLLSLPVYAHLQDGSGQEYVLVIAAPTDLENSGYPYQVIDQYQEGNVYFLALERRPGAVQSLPTTIQKKYWDGKQAVILNPTKVQINQLAALGFELERLSQEPIVLQAPRTSPLLSVPVYEPLIQEMVTRAQAIRADASQYIKDLSGVNAVTIGGSSYTIATRNTTSGTPISKATQYVYEFLKKLTNMTSVTYHNWTSGSYSGRNVVAEKRGDTNPNEIVLVVAHMDDMPTGSTAPGADDNASGSAAVMAMAEMINKVPHRRTVRFVLFTGEEQGLLGSAAYANSVAGQNIVAVFNMDMISYEGDGDPVMELHTRQTSNPGYAADREIADLFVWVVENYGLSDKLDAKILTDGESRSDHASFWNKGFAAVLAIEDMTNDESPYYHQVGDKYSTINPEYFKNISTVAGGTVGNLITIMRNSPPNPDFSYTHTGATYTFSDLSVDPAGHKVTKWSWNFGDGTTSTAQNPAHTYQKPYKRSYSVTLTAYDQYGLGASITKVVPFSPN
jgi:PKD repeat protein